jgi:hypothetical protein
MLGNDTNLDFSTSDFTIQTTLKLNGLSNGFTGAYGSAVCAGSALTNNSSILQFSGTASSHYAIGLWHQPTTTFIGRNYNFQTNKIYNLAVTKRYNVVEFFVDGTSIGTTTSSNNFNFTANGFNIGRWYFPGYEQYLKGSIFDFRAYNRALSPEELQQNYFSQTKRYYNEENIVTNGLILNIDPSKSTSYSGVGNTIYDLSGVGNNGALINGPTFSSFNGGALVLDGSNDYVLVNNAADILSKTEYTKFIFFYVTSFSTNNNLISGGVSGLNHAFWLSGSNRLYAGHNGDWATFAGNTTLSLNTWYCGAVTYSNVSGWKLYLNGVLDGTNANTTTFNNFGELQIGAYANANLFTGRISLAMVYNRALTPKEISQNFNATRYRYGI